MPGRRLQRRPWRQGGGRPDPRAPRHRGRLVRRLDADRPVHLRDRHAQRQARAGARRREEPHGRAARRRHRHGRRRRGLGRPTARPASAAWRSPSSSPWATWPIRWSRRSRTRLPKIKVGPGTDPTSEMGPLVTREHRDKVASYLDKGREQGATVVADGREHPLYDEATGFFLGVSLIDNVTPEMDSYRNEIFGPVLEVVRVPTYDGRGQARQRQPVRQRHGDLHARRRRRAPVPVRGRGRHGRHQRADPGAGRVLLVRRLEGVALRRPAHVRPGGRPVLHARKVVTSRWPDPGTSKVDLGFPRTRYDRLPADHDPRDDDGGPRRRGPEGRRLQRASSPRLLSVRIDRRALASPRAQATSRMPRAS